MIIKKKSLLMAVCLICSALIANAQNDEAKRNEQRKLSIQHYQNKMALFDQGKLDHSEFHQLILMDKDWNQGKLGNKIAENYKKTYLDKLSDEAAFTKENLSFFADDGFQLISPKDRYFRFLLTHPATDDSILVDARSYAWSLPASERLRIALRAIQRQEVITHLYDAAGNPINSPYPDFKKIEKAVRKKYPEIGDQAENIVLGAEIKYDELLKKWPDYCSAFVVRAERFGFASVVNFNVRKPEKDFPNQISSSLVMHCEDTVLLNKAILWEQVLLVKWFGGMANHWVEENTPDSKINYWVNDFANYAGLLYKAGRTDEAITWLECQLKLLKDAVAKGQGGLFDLKKAYAEKSDLLSRMKRGDKIDETWEAGWFY